MRGLGLVAALAALLVPGAALANATIVINNLDSAGEGFNDPTPVAPVGGNTGTTLGAQRLIAFEHAASIWSNLLDSPVTITIDAHFDPLTCDSGGAVLGSAGTQTIHANFTNAPVANTWYPQALANSLAGSDLSTYSDLSARFNSDVGTNPACGDFGWYLGLDGNHGGDIDLVAVLIHEFGHGLGFQTLIGQDGSWYTTAPPGSVSYPDIFGRHIYDDEVGLAWDAMSDSQRAASILNSRAVVWAGPAVTAQSPSVLDLGVPGVRVNAPGAIAGFYDAGEADFGPPLTTTGITGNVVLGVYQDKHKDVTDGCSPLTGGPYSGMIVLLDRGTCTFVTKALNAQAAGAIGVIIANNVADEPAAGMSGTDPSITIPAVMVTQATGTALKGQTGVNATLLYDGTVRAGSDGNDRVLLWTPNPYEQGSSVSHWDIIARPNLIMEPYINDGLPHDPDLALPLMTDIGWKPACNSPIADAQGFSVRYTGGTATLEWKNPAAGMITPPAVRVRTDGTDPTGPTDGTAVSCAGFDRTPGAYNRCTQSSLTNGTTYRYGLFATDAVCYAPGLKVRGEPFATTGPAKWSFATGAASLSPPGLQPGLIGAGAVYAVSNDGVVYGANPGAGGGDWPRSGGYDWSPFAMNEPAQHRPAVVPLAAGPRIFLASLDGYAYAIDAESGALVWTSNNGATAVALGTELGANPAGLFSDIFAGAPDLLFVGTRNSSGANTLFALNPGTGAVVSAMSFTNATGQNGTGGSIGIVTGVAVTYGDNRVFFTSRSGGSADTVWCLDASGAAISRVWSAAVGDIDGSPVVYGGKVYVGTTTGQVLALDAATGATTSTWSTGDGPVKGYVTPDVGVSPVRVYLATTSHLWAFEEGSASALWSTSATAPSVPLLLFGTNDLLFGDGAGTLRQLDKTSGGQTGSLPLGASALGPPSYDYINQMAYVGSTAGLVYAVALPLP